MINIAGLVRLGREEKVDLTYTIPAGPPYLFMVIVGPSGTGKSSACGNLVSYLKKAERSASLLLTDKTREPRPPLLDGSTGDVITPEEMDGVDAHFISEEEYGERAERGEYVAHFEDSGGHGYRSEDIKKGLKDGHLFVQTIDPSAFSQMINDNEYHEAAVPIALISTRANLEHAIKERPSYSSEEQGRRIASLPQRMHELLSLHDELRYVIFKSPEYYDEGLESGRYWGTDDTNHQLLRIMEREIALRKDRGLYERCLTPEANNQNFVDFLTRKIIGDTSFEDLQGHLRENASFEVRYEDVDENVINPFIFTHTPHVSEETLKHLFPLHIIAAIDAHGRRSIIFDKCTDDPHGRDIVSEFLIYWMDTYHNIYSSQTEPDIFSPSGLVEVVNKTDDKNVRIYGDVIFYLTHHLGPLGGGETITPYALNLALSNIDHSEIGERGLDARALDSQDIRRHREDLEMKAVINQRLTEYTNGLIF